MDNNEKKKNGILKVFVLLCLIITLVVFAGLAWARYVTVKNGTATAQIAKWSFGSKILNGAQTEEVGNFALTRTDENTQVDESTIAPGTSGEFVIEVDASRNRNVFNLQCNARFYK